jgi:hypothetical protein
MHTKLRKVNLHIRNETSIRTTVFVRCMYDELLEIGRSFFIVIISATLAGWKLLLLVQVYTLQ